MKTLFITPYITTQAHPAFFTPNYQTGLGYMVYDIAYYVGRSENVDLFALIVMTESFNVGNMHVIGHNYFSILKHFRLRSLLAAYRYLKKYPSCSLTHLIRIFGKFLIISQIEKIVKDYDIVHIHGVSEVLNYIIDICQEQNVKFLVTLHGLISFEEAVKVSNGLKKTEKDFLVRAAKENIPVSFISTGIKETAESYIEKAK